MNMISCFLSLLTHSTVTTWKSVPQTLTNKEELRIFLNELKTQGEKWNALKLVVLGHGEVGKTTLIHAIRRCMDPSLLSRVSTILQLTHKKMKEGATIFVLLHSFIHSLTGFCRLWTTSSHQSKMLHAAEQSGWTCRRWGWQMERSQCGTLAASLSTLSPTRCCSQLR